MRCMYIYKHVITVLHFFNYNEHDDKIAVAKVRRVLVQ